jgi:putative intracellular protease/amidase
VKRLGLALKIAGALAGAAAVGGAALYLRLPPARPKARPAAIPEDEQQRLVASLRPPRRAPPVVAIVGDNAGTETTDYLVPFAVLTESGVADVHALGTGPGPLSMFPALTVEPPETVADFDARVPDGADYVIVPALRDPAAPAAVDFIRRQRAKGATVIGICAGVRTLAAAGLVDGHRATTHWFYARELRRGHPTMTWVSDRRYVADRGIVTTTGVSASIPVSLALVEAVAGRDRAAEVAATLGVGSWDARHDSAAFGLDRRAIRTVLANRLAPWRYERLELPIAPGVDEMALALTADAYSRTYRSRALTVADGPVATRHGLRVVPDRAGPASANALPSPANEAPARALDTALAAIAARYGQPTADFVAVQLEYTR